MRYFIALITSLAMLVFPVQLFAESRMPRMDNVEPAITKCGDLVKVTGTNLDRANVAALYLTDGKQDTEVAITEATVSHIVFRIPAAAKAGRFALMVLTTGDDPKLIEEPVKLTIE